MKNLTFSAFIVLFAAVAIFAQTQKGIDTQTNTIRKESAVNDRNNDVGRSWSFGKGKTKIRKRLTNPYSITSRRDILIRSVVDVVKENKMIVDEAASRFKNGLIVTKPRVFSKGAILTKTELNRYAVVPATNQIWTRGRYTLTIEVRSIDGIRNKVGVTANIEGRSENGIFSEWSSLRSSGTAEDEFLAKLVENLGGDLTKAGRKP